MDYLVFGLDIELLNFYDSLKLSFGDYENFCQHLNCLSLQSIWIMDFGCWMLSFKAKF